MTLFSLQLNKNYRFVPTLVGALLAISGIIIFSRLGFWQIQRGYEKQNLLAAFEKRSKGPPLPFSQIESMPLALIQKNYQYQLIKGKGNYQNARQFLLDNQFYHHQVGYHVLTPLQISSTHAWLLIDRGWIPRGDSRKILPKIAEVKEAQMIEGQLYIPTHNLVLSNIQETTLQWPQVIQTFDFDALSKKLGQNIYPFVIRLAPSAPQGFMREWAVVNMPPARHFGYALQWFCFAVLCIILWGIQSLQKKTEILNLGKR